MKGSIKYDAKGNRVYFLEGKQVTHKEYEKVCGQANQSRLEDLFASQQAPRGVSDCTFMHNTANGRQFAGSDYQGDFYRQKCVAAGGNPLGKKYLSGLARFPGDPEAWVDSRDDVARVLAKRPGWKSEGSVNFQAPELAEEPKPGPAMAPDLVNQYAHMIAAASPSPREVDIDDLKGQVIEKMAPKRKKKLTKADAAHA